MRIIELQAENLKKLKAVAIRPDGNLVEITGRNGQGKSSVLDAIWWALAGTSIIQSEPIRKGAEEARIALDLGEVRVTRKFRRADGGTFTTSIVVENAEGARFQSPQKMLDGLLGSLSFDPLAFTRMEPKAQFDALRRLVPDIDFDAIDAANKDDFARRTDLNRRAKEARTRADAIVVPSAAPEPVDDAALVEELESAGEHNADIERRKARRETAERDRQEAIQKRDDCFAQAAELRKQAENLQSQGEDFDSVAFSINDRLVSAGPLPDQIDTGALREQISEARRTNDLAAAASRAITDRTQQLAIVADMTERAAALTAGMKKRDEDKAAAIAAATMPVEGLGFGNGEILLNGLPFDQASSAEQLKASVGIAMAMNPKLRVIRVQDGSLLDEDHMQILDDMAKAAGVQVWVERVDSSGRVGFVLEDGMVASHVASAVAAE